MRRYETASMVGPGWENRRQLGKEVQKRAKAWRKANPGKVKASKEQRNKLIRKIDRALKKAN